MDNIQFDYMRLMAGTLIFIFFNTTLFSPNEGNEMGSKDSDRPYKKVLYKRRFLTNVSYLTMSTIFFLNFITSYSSHPLTIWEVMLFLFAKFGFYLRMWACYELDQYFTYTIGFRKDHKIIKTGPYQYIVHPGYIGQLLLVVGGLLFFNVNIILTTILGAHATYNIWLSSKNEERMMYEEFGGKYSEFLKSRYRFIPKII